MAKPCSQSGGKRMTFPESTSHTSIKQRQEGKRGRGKLFLSRTTTKGEQRDSRGETRKGVIKAPNQEWGVALCSRGARFWEKVASGGEKKVKGRRKKRV